MNKYLLLFFIGILLLMAAGIVIKGDMKKGGEDMKVPVKTKPSEPGIVKSEQKTFGSYEEVAKEVDYPIKAPRYLPGGFELRRIALVSTPGLKLLKTKQGMVNFSSVYFMYQKDSDVIMLMQEPGDEARGIAAGPEGSMSGVVNVQGVEGKWSRGWWSVPGNTTPDKIIEAEKRWTEEGLRLAWSKDGLSFFVEARGNISLEELVNIGNSLEDVKAVER